MSYEPFAIDRFGGLNLVGDPQEIGAEKAVDLMNVDLDTRGRVRSRDGYTAFTSAGSAIDFDLLAPFYQATGSRQLITSRPNNANGAYITYDTAGAIEASGSTNIGDGGYNADVARFGGPTTEVIYVTSQSSSGTVLTVRLWTGAAWTSSTTVRLGGTGVYPYALEVKADENRLVGAFSTSGFSRVGFSNPGTPETWDANNYVDLTPGDGEKVTALVSWRELVFAFKLSRFFVFTSTSVSSTGSAIFNYRPVSNGVGCITRAGAVSTPNGVYFLSRRGIYRTTGGDPVLVSRDIDPIFRGGEPDAYQGGILNHAAIDKCALTWHDERLCFAFPSGSSTTNDRLLVFDPEVGTWLLWDIAASKLASFRADDEADLIFSYAPGLTHDIGRFSAGATDDDGTAITSRYQSGFYELAPGRTAWTRWTRVEGSGSPTVDVYTDSATSDPLARGGPVTLGTAPAVAEGFHQKSYEGRRFSHRFSSTSPWSVSSLVHDIAHSR